MPPTQPRKKISASYTYFDEHDVEGTSLYSWLIDGIELSNSLSFTLPNDSEGKALTFCITPIAVAGGETQGLQVCTDITIKGEYSKPSAESFILTTPITTGIEISASYAFIDESDRLEGDSIFNWKINDNDFSSNEKITLAANHQGSQLSFCLTPIAISGENATGDVVCSEDKLIGTKIGTAPTIENQLMVNFVKAGNQVSLTYDYIDDDGDLEASTAITWLIDNVELSQEASFTLPDNSAGKLLTMCITPKAMTGIPTEGTTQCIDKYIADIVITGELEIYETITLAIKGYSHNGVTWRILHPSYSPIRSTDSSNFTITGSSPTEEANWILGHDLEVCIDTTEEGEICLLASEQPTNEITGGLPTELDIDNNITKRVIAPVSFIDLTISETSKRLYRPLNVIESILLNLSSGGSVPLHDEQSIDANTSIVWALYHWQTAMDSCINQSMVLPVQGVSDISDSFGLHQFYNQTVIDYPVFPDSYIVRAMGWPGVYYRSSSFHSAGNHYDYYLVNGSDDFINDSRAEAAACLSTIP
jgi:hypothetical protein